MNGPRSIAAILFFGPALLALLSGCSPSRQDAVDRTEYEAEEDEWSSSEAERTRDLEARADAMNSDFRAAVDDAESEEDVLRAYQEFEASRQELNEAAEADDYGGSGDLDDSEEWDDSDEYAPEP